MGDKQYFLGLNLHRNKRKMSDMLIKYNNWAIIWRNKEKVVTLWAINEEDMI